MTDKEIREIFLKELNKIAPDIGPDDVSDDDHIQDDLELDSMDVLNLVTALDEALGVSIPEVDYPQIETLAKAVQYLSSKLQ
ncbi:acyl carrier protein [Actibacterium pelagium]|uniref:Carrier domain-containing protein n=1 Tax=Actibacterium pelagium TaxID=2029103 RepID=A0A917AGJ4_9RHOB|nr:acyl carrier protein [Actibacterium pelagium]GGE50856.1 hypothetical protein GCM10011517_18280 [Actibacterium pelagium]